ncbi:MAG: phosphoribosyltransferase [Planctomycetota bacterium]
MLYKDRVDAGRRLAELLSEYRVREPIVLGLPRGGVVVAQEVADALHAPLDVLIVRKLGAPSRPEFAFGAIASGGYQLVNRLIVRHLGLSEEQVEDVIQRETAELDRRLEIYRGERPQPDLCAKTVIIVDDGLATGSTAKVAVHAARSEQPEWVVLAVPVAPPDAVEQLEAEVNDLVCPSVPPNFRALSQWYQQFDQVTDEEVVELLRGSLSRRNTDADEGQ